MFYCCRCFQERLLSKRVIRFQADEVIFECNEGLTCECSNPPDGHQGPWEDLSQHVHLHDKAAFDNIPYQHSHVSVGEFWRHLVHAYSRTYLTRESDRMNAFAGIVNLYQQQSMSKSHYLAGLWGYTLWADLLWSVVGKKEYDSQQRWSRQPVTIPSWS
jgi:hypothetical protein